MIFQQAHLFFPFSDAVTESMSWFWFALYLHQTLSQFAMRRLQKVQFEDGLQRERAVNVQFVKTFILNTFTCLNIQGSKQLNDFFFFGKFEAKQSYD